MLATTPHYLKDARSKGLPSVGEGRIYPFADEDLAVSPFAIPPHFRRGYGLDDGWHRTAVVWGALDPDTDILYLTTEHYRAEASPEQNALAVKARGEWIPGVGDAAARARDGEQIIAKYQAHGLNLILADKQVDAGIYDVYERMMSARLKVFNTCQNWFAEARRYHRDEKWQIVKRNDHLMDATRYLCRPSGIARMIAKPVERIIGQGGAAVGDRKMGY